MLSVDFDLSDIQKVRENIKTREQANAINPISQWSLLMQTVQLGKIEIVKYLLKLGADINYSCPLKWTALMIACLNGPIQLIKLLVEYGADVNAICNKGFTPLIFLMINKNNEDKIAYLINKGADLQYIIKWKENNEYIFSS